MTDGRAMPHAPIIMTTAKLPRKSPIIIPYLNSRLYSGDTVALVLSAPVNAAETAASSVSGGRSCSRTRQMMKITKVTRNTPMSGKIMRTAFTGSSVWILQHMRQWLSMVNYITSPNFRAVDCWWPNVQQTQKSSLFNLKSAAVVAYTYPLSWK